MSSNTRRLAAGLVSVLALVLSVLVAVPAQAASTASISGKLTFVGGQGNFKWGGFHVMIYSLDSSDAGIHGASINEDGTYVANNLPAGRYKIEFQSSDRAFEGEGWGGVADYRDSAPIVLAQGEKKTGINGTFTATGSISGTLRAPAGKPFVVDEHGDYGRVHLYRELSENDFWYAAPAVVNEKGEFTFAQRESGRYKILFIPVGGIAQEEWFGGTDFEEEATIVTLAKGEHLSVEHQLVEGATVSGRVLAADGSPFDSTSNSKPGEAVLSEGRFGPVKTKIKADGTYQFRGLVKGEYSLRFEPNDGIHAAKDLGAESTWDAVTALTVGKQETIALPDETLA